MIAAGLLAKKAVARGLTTQAVGEDEPRPGVEGRDRLPDRRGPARRPGEAAVQRRRLRLHDLHRQQRPAAGRGRRRRSRTASLVVAAVLSGNRNFEGRVHPEVRANYLASPPLVVAYALAGRVDIDWDDRAVGTGKDGQPVFLKDIWPTRAEVAEVVRNHLRREQYERVYSSVFEGDDHSQEPSTNPPIGSATKPPCSSRARRWGCGWSTCSRFSMRRRVMSDQSRPKARWHRRRPARCSRRRSSCSDPIAPVSVRMRFDSGGEETPPGAFLLRSPSGAAVAEGSVALEAIHEARRAWRAMVAGQLLACLAIRAVSSSARCWTGARPPPIRALSSSAPSPRRRCS